VRVNVQLINAQTDSHLWADTYDRKLTDIFVVESEIAKRIAKSLQATLTSSEEQALAVKPTNNPQASGHRSSRCYVLQKPNHEGRHRLLQPQFDQQRSPRTNDRILSDQAIVRQSDCICSSTEPDSRHTLRKVRQDALWLCLGLTSGGLGVPAALPSGEKELNVTWLA
jgi:hypothetical protein